MESVHLELAGQIETWDWKKEVTGKAVRATTLEIETPAPQVRKGEQKTLGTELLESMLTSPPRRDPSTRPQVTVLVRMNTSCLRASVVRF